MSFTRDVPPLTGTAMGLRISPGGSARPHMHGDDPAAVAGSFVANLHERLVSSEQSSRPTFRYAAGELFYVIDVPATLQGHGTVVDVMWRKATRAGGWTRARAAKISADDAEWAPDADRLILALLLGASGGQPSSQWFYHQGIAQPSRFRLSDALTTELLPAMARTGRIGVRPRVGKGDPLPLLWDDGPAWTFRLVVTPRASGFHVAGRFERGPETLSLTDPVLVLATGFLVTRRRIGRLDHGGRFSLIAELRASGEADVPARAASHLAHALARAGVPAADLPEPLRLDEIDVAPSGRLALSVRRGSTGDRLDATVSFDYAGMTVGLTGAAAVFDATRRRIVRRRAGDEARLMNQVIAAGAQPGYDDARGRATLELPARQLSSAVRALVPEGWHVEAHGRSYRFATSVHLAVASGIDWFDLDATVAFGETTVPLADVLAAITRGDGGVRLGDGSIGVLAEDWLRRYLPLTATAEPVDGKLRFRRSQAALLDALLEDRAEEAIVSVDGGFDRIRRELAAFSAVEPADPPASFIGTLRPYQREGLGWFHFLRRFGFGGCLADDMGLGKTVMVLALLAWWREERARLGAGPRPSVIVVPRSLVENWTREAARFVPVLRVVDYSGANRAAGRATLDEADVVLVTYGTLRQDVAALKDVEFEYAILDEAQAIKNAATASAKAARLVRARHRLALTGTPIENHLGELWSVFEFLNPGLLGAASSFARAASAADPDPAALSTVARGLRPFLLRRTKQQVARDLPARNEQTIACQLSPPERAFYDGLRRHYRDTLLTRIDRVGLGRSKIQVLEALLRLRQAACHMGLVDPSRRGGPSAKFELLLSRLHEVMDEGHKAVVFSQFTTLLGLLRTSLDAEGIVYEYLDGRTRDRQARVDRFQTDAACPLFLVSLRAGGVGLNLTAAEYVFLLDPWWNPAVEAQAIDRTHRIGQTRDVFAYRLIAADTVEEKVLALQQTKRDLADAVLAADGTGLRHLERADLELLLS